MYASSGLLSAYRKMRLAVFGVAELVVAAGGREAFDAGRGRL
jgi:hypothetical protein